MVLLEQLTALMDFLESHPEIALGRCSRTIEGRSLAKRLWSDCAQILNSISTDCPTKSPTEWRTFYNEYKSKMLKKIKLHKREISATGGGSAKKIILTPLQERLYDILGRDVGEPLPGVRHNPVSPIITMPAVVEVDVSASNANNSILILENEDILYTEATTNLSENVESPIISQEHSAAPPLPQPPRRRRQRPARRYPQEDRDHTALDASQARLERMESLRAEATLEHARATNNLAVAIEQSSTKLAAAIDRIGDILSRMN